MLKVLLVDDEKNVCLLLRNLIDWNANGFEIIGEAHDGDSAFDMACTLAPDILITDIKLPGINGLELVEKIRNSGTTPFIILISGHQKFEYAHTAIQYGVENYLLKPICKQDLIDNLLNIKDKIYKQKKEEDLEHVADLTQKKLRHQFLFSIARRHIKPQDFDKLNSEYSLGLQNGKINILIIKEDFLDLLPDTQVKILENKLLELSKKLLSDICFSIDGIAFNGYCVFYLNHNVEKSDIVSKLHDILYYASEYCHAYCHLTLGLGFESVNHISCYSAESAYLAISMRMLLGYNSIYDCDDLNKGNIFSLTPDDMGILTRDVEIWNIEQIPFHMKSLAFQYDITHSNPPKVIEEGNKLLGAVKDILQKMYIDANLTLATSQILINTNELTNCTSLISYWNTLSEIITASLSSFLSVYQLQEKGVVNQAKEYIKTHYESEISLEEVAEHVHMSVSYFSSVFKKEEGITFIKYVTNFRLGKAKTLLKDPQYNIGQIAHLVGYSDTKYFTKLFKKEVGLKPSEYRKLYTKGHR